MRKFNYSDFLTQWLLEAGYTHCFFVAGGNIMHILDSLRKKMIMIPFVHEVAGTIGCEYFNLSSKKKNLKQRAFSLVTAGPGITNAATGVAGSNIESRELLIIGGQVKTSDLSEGLRQRGIQEADGKSIMEPITKLSIRLDQPVSEKSFKSMCRLSQQGRPGSVFIEIPLDIQASNVSPKKYKSVPINMKQPNHKKRFNKEKQKMILKKINESERPLILLGGGIERNQFKNLEKALERFRIPFQTTWNGIDLVGSSSKLYFGRPNTWGQRYANLIIQQSDLIISLGSRLGLQQTGFNWQEFGKNAFKVMVDIDEKELKKGHPKVNLQINDDASQVLIKILNLKHNRQFKNWINYCNKIKAHFPLSEKINKTGSGYINPYDFSIELSKKLKPNDVIIPCSSGGASTTIQQSFLQKKGQVIMNTKGMAAMGYGLSGAIGASLSMPKKRTVLIEGDGGFIQNMQELGTVAINKLNLKIFIFHNNGYASIRMTQKNYFGGAYVGCDEETGLSMPNWKYLAKAFGINYLKLKSNNYQKEIDKVLKDEKSWLCIVPIDPEQSYFPKITSRITSTGSMESNPLHNMSPELSLTEKRNFLNYI